MSHSCYGFGSIGQDLTGNLYESDESKKIIPYLQSFEFGYTHISGICSGGLENEYGDSLTHRSRGDRMAERNGRAADGVNRGGRWSTMKRGGKSKPLGWKKSTAPWAVAQRRAQREQEKLIRSISPEEKEALAAMGEQSAHLVPSKAFFKPLIKGTVHVPGIRGVIEKDDQPKPEAPSLGRPAQERILHAVRIAAQAKAERGTYRWIARQMELSPVQLSDWVRTHKNYFDDWVARYQKDKLHS